MRAQTRVSTRTAAGTRSGDRPQPPPHKNNKKGCRSRNLHSPPRTFPAPDGRRAGPARDVQPGRVRWRSRSLAAQRARSARLGPVCLRTALQPVALPSPDPATWLKPPTWARSPRPRSLGGAHLKRAGLFGETGNERPGVGKSGPRRPTMANVPWGRAGGGLPWLPVLGRVPVGEVFGARARGGGAGGGSGVGCLSLERGGWAGPAGGPGRSESVLAPFNGPLDANNAFSSAFLSPRPTTTRLHYLTTAKWFSPRFRSPRTPRAALRRPW